MSEKQQNETLTVTGLIYEFLRNHKSLVVLYIAFLCIMPIKDIGIPHLFGTLVKSIEERKSMIPPLIMLFISSLFVQMGYSIIDYLEVELSPRFQEFVRQKIIRHLMEINNTDYQEVESGKVIARLVRLPMGIYSFFNQWKYVFIPYTLLSITAILYFLWNNTILGVLLFFLIVFAWTMIYVSVSSCQKYSYQSEDAAVTMYEDVDDVLKNLNSVLNSNQTETELNNIRSHEASFRDNVKNTLVCSMKIRYSIVPINTAYFMFFMYFCYKQVQQKKMKASAFVALIIIVFKIFNVIWDVSGIMNEVVSRWGVIKQSMEVFNKKGNIFKEIDTTTKSHGIVPTTGFYFENITFSYVFPVDDSIKTILPNLTLHIRPSETVVIVGGIGSGKSTILKLMLKQVTPESGRIYFQGVPYELIKPEDLRSGIGYIQQNPILFNRSIYDNIVYGLDAKTISKEQVWNLIEQLELKPMFTKFPQELDTKVGKYGSHLSGGQRQIILLLRIILQNPPILLMDEPTASIDEKTKETVYNLISKLMQNRTVVMVTHDDFLLRFADRSITLQDGNILKDEYKSEM